jgi:large subunit ribosomal protein L5e
MPFAKILKNNTYSKRFQVKFRRRRLGKTDYYQRKRLILQRKNKYNTPKYRFIVRKTNARIICQIAWSTIKGDKIKAYADSFELKKYGLTAGLTNYAAAYCTGLLCARRLLATLDNENAEKGITTKMSDTFNLIKEVSAEDVDFKELCEEKNIDQRPFVCYLDIGLARSTNGNKVFAAMKGAIDGGIHIPHSDNIFPGHNEIKEEEEAKPKGKKGAEQTQKKEIKKQNPELLRERILGIHVQKYMNLYANKKDKKEYQFSQWKLCMKNAGVKNLEDLYKKIHNEIRKNPLAPEKKKQELKYKRKEGDKNIVIAPNGKEFRRDFKLTNAQRKERVNEKIRKFL